MEKICPDGLCTSCKLCENVCPKHCVTIESESDGDTFAYKDETLCVKCGLCKKVCPSLNGAKSSYPLKAYAAWSNNPSVHRASASGGIAAELYKKALSEGWLIAGVEMSPSFETFYKLSDSDKDIPAFQNSKYVYSDPRQVYSEIRKKTALGQRVLFIGLPCHVAALSGYAEKYGFRDKLLLVDLACHGTPPSQYFKQHIQHLEKTLGKNLTRCSFRDPKFGTYIYFFTVYNNNELLYKADTLGDLYCFGYHKALIYRECCYNCLYAKRERVGDLTICDYSGLGTLSLYTKNRKSVSCVLVNTPEGENLIRGGYLTLHERPVEEPLRAEGVFNHPYRKKSEVDAFKQKYTQCADFEKSAEIVFAPLIRNARKQQRTPKRYLRSALEEFIPQPLVYCLKVVMRRIRSLR